MPWDSRMVKFQKGREHCHLTRGLLCPTNVQYTLVNCGKNTLLVLTLLRFIFPSFLQNIFCVFQSHTHLKKDIHVIISGPLKREIFNKNVRINPTASKNKNLMKVKENVLWDSKNHKIDQGYWDIEVLPICPHLPGGFLFTNTPRNQVHVFDSCI